MRLSLFSTPSVLPSATLRTEAPSNTNLQREGRKKQIMTNKLQPLKRLIGKDYLRVNPMLLQLSLTR